MIRLCVSMSVGVLLSGLLGCSGPPPCRVMPGLESAERSDAACLVRRDHLVLAVSHRRSGRLDLPGGRNERAETAQCTAHREVWEETGIDVVVGRLLVRSDSSRLYECLALPDAQDSRGLPARLWARLEIEGVEWTDPRDHDRRDWRFRHQLRRIRSALSHVEPE